jgi:hypothetical protein
MVNVPVEAVKAAHSAICEQNLDDCLDPDWRGKCVKAVEAAAPYLRADAWDEGLTAGHHDRRLNANPYRTNK